MTLYNKLRDIEIKLDELNADYGTKWGYCIFCDSTEYNGSFGIVHSRICPIIQIREKLKKENE